MTRTMNPWTREHPEEKAPSPAWLPRVVSREETVAQNRPAAGASVATGVKVWTITSGQACVVVVVSVASPSRCGKNCSTVSMPGFLVWPVLIFISVA